MRIRDKKLAKGQKRQTFHTLAAFGSHVFFYFGKLAEELLKFHYEEEPEFVLLGETEQKPVKKHATPS